MRLNVFVVLLSCLISLIATGVIDAQDSEDSSATTAREEKPSTISLLMGRPVNVASSGENKWVPALIEASLEFKFSVINGITVIKPDDVARLVRGHHNFQKPPQQSDYIEAAKRLGVPYFLDQKYELTRDKMVYYYAEVISVKNGDLFTTIEKSFKADQFGSGIDELVGLIMVAFNITPQKELARFVRMPVAGANFKNISALGDLIVKERFETNIDSARLADEYRLLCEKDRSLILGYYRAGLFFEIIGRYADATEALNILFMTIPEYTPVYVPLTRTFRKAKRYDEAIRIALLGQKKGVKSSELSSELAIAYTAAGKKREAEDVFRSIMSSDPQDPFALLFYARKANDEGKGAEALEYAERLLKMNAEPGWAQAERGRALMQLSRKDEAITALVEATTLLPSEIDPVRYLADLYESTGQYSKALSQYEKVLKKAVNDVDLFIKTAAVAQKSGDVKRALALLYSIESRFSNHGELQKNIGLLELTAGDSGKARTHLEAGSRSGSEDGKVLTELGKLYIKSKEYDKAFTNLTRALTLVKEKDTVRAALVVVYLKKGEAGSALSILETMKTCQDQIPELNRMIGDSFFERKQFDKALLYYRKELGSKNDAELQKKIADLSFTTESPLSAKNEYLKLVKAGGTGAEVYYRLVLLFLKLKDGKSADTYLEKAAVMGDADAVTWSQIGQEYQTLGYTDRAIEAYRQSIKKSSSSENERLKLIELYKKTRNDSAAAEVCYDLYSVNKTGNSKYLLEAATLFEKAGASDKAARMYSAALEKNAIDPKGKVKLAEMEFEAGNFQKVVSLLGDLSSAYINEKEARFLAESWFALGQFEKALEQLTFIQRKNPQDIRAVELSARISDTLGRYDEAVRFYSKYLLTKGKNQDYAYRTGILYEKLKQVSSAITQYTNNIRLYPDDYRNYDRLARLYVESNKMTSAIPVLKKAVTFKEAQPDLNGMLARALAGQGSAAGGQEAISQFEAYLQKNSNDYDGWVQLGNLYNAQARYSEAATAFEKAISIKNNDFKVLKLLGKVYLKLDRANQALDLFTKARNLNQDDNELLKLLVDGNRAAGNSGVLVNLLKDLVAKNPGSYDLQLELANLLLKQGMESDAVQVFETVAGMRKCQVDIHMQLARLYEKTRNEERRMYHINAASLCSPRNPQLNIELGRYNFRKQNFAKAETYLLTAYQSDKNNAELCYLLGSAQREQKKFNSARVYLQKAAQLEPSNQAYGLASAELLYSEGKYVEALKLIQPAISGAGNNASALRIAGLIYKSNGDNGKALQLLESAVLADQSCGECYSALGDLYVSNGDYKKAANAFERVSSIGGENDALVAKLANVYVKLQQYDPAKKILVKVVQKNPRNSEALYRLCHLLIREKQFDDVRRYTLSASVKTGWHHLVDAELNEVLGKLDAATVSYTKAIKALPNVSEAQAGCGRINLARKKYANAITYLGQAMAGDPDNIQLYLDLGKAYEGSGDLSTAIELYKEVETRMSDHPEVHYCMARVYSRQNDHNRAVDALYAGIARNKKSTFLYIALGHEYRLLKQSDKAIDAYLRATKIDESKGIDGYKFVGHVYYSLNDPKKAKKYYEMYIGAGGNDPKVTDMIRRIP
ncbi:MAG TPA: tetratricopeptide repeat protein [Chitinispirillaceae bacterium]|nr:tetratricopeptide repeat protein [Chitinispirillaceae bacterium]